MRNSIMKILETCHIKTDVEDVADDIMKVVSRPRVQRDYRRCCNVNRIRNYTGTRG